MTSMIKTNVFFRFYWFSGTMPQCLAVEPGVPVVVDGPRQQVREVFIVHVGGTRCVPSSTGKNRTIRARITWTVEFIRGCIFICVFYVWIQGRVWSRLTLLRFYWFSQLQWPRGLRRHRRPLPLRQRLAPGFAQRLQLVDVPRRLQQPRGLLERHVCLRRHVHRRQMQCPSMPGLDGDRPERSMQRQRPVWFSHGPLRLRYVKSLLYMLVVLVVYLPVPTTLWTYVLVYLWLLKLYEPVFVYFYCMWKYKDE